MKNLLVFLALVFSLVVVCDSACTEIQEDTVNYVGLFETDGNPGITVVGWTKYDPESNVVCEVGIRFPSQERLTHCSDPSTCPASPQVLANLEFEGSRSAFKSIGYNLNPSGHPNGNYKEYREAWDNCANNDLDCSQKPLSWSYLTPHVNVHFFYEPIDSVNEINWDGFPVTPAPSAIADNCAAVPPLDQAAPKGFYPLGDCVPQMGQHWGQDKFETMQTFINQPSWIWGTYNAKPAFIELMITPEVMNWVRDNGIDQRAEMYMDRTEDVAFSAYYPTKYSFGEVTDSDKLIGGGRTVFFAVNEFEARQPRDYHSDDSDESGASAVGSLFSLFFAVVVYWVLCA